PFFAGIGDSETANLLSVIFNNANGADPAYSDTLYSSSIQSYYLAAIAAFPNASVELQNTFMHASTPCQNLSVFAMNNRISIGAAASSPYSYYAAHGVIQNGWGAAARAGVTVSGSTFSGPDRRATTASSLDVQSPDYGTTGSGTGPGNRSALDG